MTQRATHRRAKLSLPIMLIGLALPGTVTTPARAAEPPDEKMDCRIYETKTSSFGLGVRFGAMLLPLLGPLSPSASAAPTVTFDRKTGVAWDKTVHGLVARYVELCTRYNAGLVTKQEYEARMKEIEGIHKDMAGLESKVFEETRGHAQSAQQDLDRSLSKRPAAKPGATTTVADSLATLSRRVDQLDTGPPPQK